MDPDKAISVRNVSKKYRLFSSPKQRLLEALHPFKSKYHREFWALKDVSFDVPKAHTFGIIGRNGSGKSTLLQIICRILQPTSGSVEVHGRTAALLGLGAGFNPDFTGRENVLLNGTMMGFSREEMEERLPQIENFADIGDFFHQPVKTYSSGMFVRLAFACAVNVNPDILVIDEVLAVGDACFQYKCFQKICEFQERGKTIVVVSHDVESVVRHCNHCILLESGILHASGPPRPVVDIYYEQIITRKREPAAKGDGEKRSPPQEAPDRARESGPPSPVQAFIHSTPLTDNCPSRLGYNPYEKRMGDRRAELVDFLVVDRKNRETTTIYSGDEIDIYMKVRSDHHLDYFIVGFSIKNKEGIVVYASNTGYQRIPIPPVEAGQFMVSRFSFKMNLHEGDYFIDLGVAEPTHEAIDVRYGILHLTVCGKSQFDGFVELESSFEEVVRYSSLNHVAEEV
jgi:lipopolysaccharide transport system ATP-binding protein